MRFIRVQNALNMATRFKNILIGKQGGKTLLERMLGGKEELPSPALAGYNPLRLALNDLVELRAEDAGTYNVVNITTYRTDMGDHRFDSAKYFLRDRAAADASDTLVLEVIAPAEGDAPEQFLFHVLEEMEYAQDFMQLLDDEIFVINEETDDGEIEKEYEKMFHVTSETRAMTADGPPRSGRVEVWNYEREDEFETTYLAIEVDTDDGWTTMYEGRKVLGGEINIFPLSGEQSA